MTTAPGDPDGDGVPVTRLEARDWALATGLAAAVLTGVTAALGQPQG